MRLITFAAVGCLSLTSSLWAQVTEDSFQQAYGAYQQALTDNNVEQQLPLAVKAYNIGRELYGNDHINTAVLAVTAMRHLPYGRKNKALLEHALGIFEETYGPKAPELIDVLMELGIASLDRNADKEGNNHFKRALKLSEAHYGKQSLTTANLYLESGINLLAYAESTKALSTFETALKLFRALGEDENALKVGEAYFWIGKFKLAKHATGVAIDNFKNFLEIYEEKAPTSPLVDNARRFMILCHERLGNSDEATKYLLALGANTPYVPLQNWLPIYKISAEYPAFALKHKIEGSAIIELTVDADGRVKNPHILTYEGSQQFGKEAIKAIRKFRYIPRYADGIPVETEGVLYKFEFELGNFY